MTVGDAIIRMNDVTALKRILIVDDEPTILLTLSYALQTKNLEVVTASRLEQAEEALKRQVFDLVIADIRMSGMLGVEGLELLTYIKRYWPETRVIIMTAHGSEDIQQDAYERGAIHYYQKPVDIRELMRKIEELGIPLKT
jgi:DNA-binding NtrC family response regulator